MARAMQPITISTFYYFTTLAEPKALRESLLEHLKKLGIKGTMTLATEGINATVSGSEESIRGLILHLHRLIGMPLDIARKSYFGEQPFLRTKVKVKKELISLGAKAEPSVCVGRYVTPQAWNAFITASDVITIDTRNDYEYALGHFAGAVNPGTRNFKQMVAFTQAHLLPVSGRRIAMYCTGGIRCEKYSSYLVSLGFTQVYHLQGGILAYLEQVPVAESLWRGSCFVFDGRGGVEHGLMPVAAGAS